MATKVIRINSEWDIGEEGYVYVSKERARQSLDNNPNVDEIGETDECTLDDLIGDGLIGFETLELVD